MGVFDKLLRRKAKPQRIAFGSWPNDPTASDDMRTWSAIGRRALRDLGLPKQQQMIDRGFNIYRTNPLLRGIVRNTVNFIIGEGLSVDAKNEKVKELLDEFRAKNHIAEIEQDMCCDQILTGELCVIAPVNEIDASVTVGFVDAKEIKEILVNPMNYNEAQFVVLVPAMTGQQERKLRIIHEEDVNGQRRLVGDCFFWTVNKSLTGTRGISDFYASFDWCEGLEDLEFSALERAMIQLRYAEVWAYPGTDPQTLQRMATPGDALYQPVPKSGTRILTSAQTARDGVSFISPELGAAELVPTVEMFREMILAGTGIPKHWLGSGVDVNRASAMQMDTPAQRWLQGRQKKFIDQMRQMYQFVIDQQLLLTEKLSGLSDEELEFEVTAPEVATKDEMERSQTLVNKINALAAAHMGRGISDLQFADATVQALRDSGFDIEELPAGEVQVQSQVKSPEELAQAEIKKQFKNITKPE